MKTSLQITDDAVFAAMEAGGNETRAWSMIERNGVFLVHDRFRQRSAVSMTDETEMHQMSSREMAVSFVSFRTYKAAIEAALNYQPENEDEADQPLRDNS